MKALHILWVAFCMYLCMTGALPLYAQVAYKMSPQSKMQISGTSTVSNWVVSSEQVTGEMIFVPAETNAAARTVPAGTIREGKAILEVATIKSEKGETMDNKMYKALKSDAHPRITFVLTAPVEFLKLPSTVSLKGNVEIAGVVRSMTFDLNLVYSDNTYHFQGSQSLKFSDFNIEPPTAMFGQIETGDEIAVAFDLFFVP